MNSLPTIQKMLIEEFGLTADQVGPEAQLEALGIDSLATIEFMFLLEDKFGLAMPEEQVDVKTVGDISRELDQLISQRDAPAAG